MTIPTIPTITPEDSMSVLVTKYPEGTELDSICPECLLLGGRVIDKTFCYGCVVIRSEWIRIVWRRRR